MSLHGTHVWVRTDLLEAVYEHGELPKTWKARKRNRWDAEWGWCRAMVQNSEKGAGSRTGKATADENTGPQSPFGAVQLRKVKSPMKELRSPTWKLNSPPPKREKLFVTVKVEDAELAPPHLQGESLSITYDTGDTSLVCMANAWWMDVDGGVPPDDLCQLEQLHEPSVVYCLQRRYERYQIYTYTGKILLALNPFCSVDIYGPDVMQQYCSVRDKTERPPPHVYSIAQDAYQSMMIHADSSQQNQSILVSGESGAGKTVTTKIIMNYLASMSQREQENVGCALEQQVLQSNPILESFGNARTVRNDNSSRFGKFMEIQFDTHGVLVSANIQTYLLEKSRLISQAAGERNYHVFYEVLAGLPQKDRRDYHVANANASSFVITSSSGTFDRRDQVQDRDTYRGMREALDTVGFTEQEQHNLVRVVCMLLHASNLSFIERAADASELCGHGSSLNATVALLGVDVQHLEASFCRCAIEVRGETLNKNLSVEQAHKAREAFMKATYGALFVSIVCRINESISASHEASSSPRVAKTASIGILDIFGFESFDCNSFEQLTINYCNEALQQQFNRFVFTLEQQEYRKEGIRWDFISFPDNQDVLDLIEKKHDGILGVLDEQSRLQRCTDKTFALAIYEKCAPYHRFEATKAQQASLSFGIHHYAGIVEYSTEGFLEKNKDELPKETTDLLLSSSHAFFAELGRLLDGSGHPHSRPKVQPRGGERQRKQIQRTGSTMLRESVGFQFKQQLEELRRRIEATAPHYVRCLKPNDELVPHNFNAVVIADQLRCAGVLEAIRVSRVGFPHRYFHDHFVQRYKVLASRKDKRLLPGTSKSEICEALFATLMPQLTALMDSDNEKEQLEGELGMQMGKTKVFLRRRAFEALEYLRSRRLEMAAIKIQSITRMFNDRITFEIACYAVAVIQNFFRKIHMIRLEHQRRLLRSVEVLQRGWRFFLARRYYHAALCIAWWGQSTFRGTIARQYCAYLFLDTKAMSIQRVWKSHCSSRTFRRFRKGFIAFQTRARMVRAKRQLHALRLEARDLSKVAAERDELREESRRLRAELETAKKSSASVLRSEKAKEIEDLRIEVQRLRLELDKKHRMGSPNTSLNSQMQVLMQECQRKEGLLSALRHELESLRSRDEHSTLRSITASGSVNVKEHLGMESPTMSLRRFSPTRSTDASLLDADADTDSFHVDSDFPFTPPAKRKHVPPPSYVSTADKKDELDADELRRLHIAVRQKNRLQFDQILAGTLDVCLLINEGDQHGKTALHFAVLAGDLQIVEALIGNGAAVNVQDEDGETPLHLAENASFVKVLVTKGKANPNIPNIDGICPLHLAVQKRDFDSISIMLDKGAQVNNADNIRWFTPLHLVALPARSPADETAYGQDTRQKIAEKLLAHNPDLNAQDSEGNTPLHYASQLDAIDTCDLLDALLAKGADPNICNERDQSPLHLLCHNEDLRRLDTFHEMVRAILDHGGNPNLESQTGCTALHLSLYHRDIDSAVQLVAKGGELHVLWKKPSRWPTFWKHNAGNAEVLALDMVDDENELHRILGAISGPHKWAPARSCCMHCHSTLGTFARAMHCRHCSRLICSSCASACLPPQVFPKAFRVYEAAWVCLVCEPILLQRVERTASNSSGATQPLSMSATADEEERLSRFSC